MADVDALSTVGYDTWIVTVQHAEVIVETHEDAMRWADWLTGQGYAFSGPYPWDEGTLRLTFVLTRGTVADSRRGDAVAFDGRYEVAEDG